ncbi:AAA family ATPase [Blautia wexlerae]|uniref:AAA family ATPase n=2 Tax=Blautia wexlerae TaxID=418240 RepID=A0ABX2GNC7_9FIRM|nr:MULTISPECIES: AAA family ATPase [Blautia]MCB7526885.1 ATP-binding protein [Blautia sp. MSK18_10]MZS91954.1 AAA family ATPase [Blautia wexlerae]MZS96098.1 AAA family ATPase [Blautia wexlerae]MZT01185.1 AAA family ATPase [Blautia wexlerae]MZT05531.1 AAA family ATPase [Blautia wexlerae]
MAGLKKLPIGIENFEKLRQEDFYYIDKTRLIEQLLTRWGEVNLFTRPRRFGKSLNMSMLQSFFEIGKDKTLFDGLRISDNQELCEKYQGKFPVVSVSLKGINGATYEEARRFLIKTINEEARRLSVLSDSTELDETDHELLTQLKKKEMTNDSLVYSIRELTELLEKHYGSKVIVLIDEYDVPLAKANENGYYDEMVLLIRNLFENALKTNNSLKFAVLTGCLRIAKESIFTGLNNFKVYSITDKSFDETFGFTDEEVKELLRYYGQKKYYETVKEWYDGYRFGNVDVYCPWDVINFCSDHLADPGLEPKNYWANTSGNSVISHFIDSVGKPQKLTRMELEQLVNGGIVQKEINFELTYKELYSSIDNLWSTLFMTGYLTQRGEPSGNRYNLVIPNREIRNIITNHILKMFKENVKDDGKTVSDLCDALLNQNPEKVELIFTEYMKKTISIRDTFARKPTKENFYHGLLLGILGFKENWSVMSNRESGDGFGDILIRIEDEDVGIVIEVKYADDGNLQGECEKALQQIIDIRYTEALEQEGIHTIIKYGIACYRKKCKVLMRIDKQ